MVPVPFKIGLDELDRGKLRRLWGKILETQQWSEGSCTDILKQKRSECMEGQSVSCSMWRSAALAFLEFCGCLEKKLVL